MKTRHILRAAADNAARSSANADAHPDPDTLLGYARGEIEGEAKARIQEHLSLCATCATAVLDLLAFPYNPPPADADLTDREIDAQWLRLVGREKGPGFGRRWVAAAHGGRFGVFGYGLAATFLVALVGLSAWTVNLRDRVTQLSEPRVNVFVAHLSDDETRGPASKVEISSDVKYVRFQMLVSDSTVYEDYRVSIRDAYGREIVGNSDIEPSPGGEFNIEMDAGQLPVGTGSILLFGSIGDRETALAEYAFSKLPPRAPSAPR